MKQILDCPRCKEKVGWWEKRQTSYSQYFMAGGESSHTADNPDSFGRGGKRKFCYNCNLDITNCIES